MELTGEQLIPAAQAEVWRGLNDPEVLKACAAQRVLRKMMSHTPWPSFRPRFSNLVSGR